MKAAVLTGYGSAERFIIQNDVVPPRPAANQIQVKVIAAGLNPLDYKIRKGELRWIHPQTFPAILGNDLSGIVTAVGEDVCDFSLGDEVFGMMDSNPQKACNGFARPGAYAEYAITRTDTMTAKPDALSHEDAAVLPLAALTAWQALSPFLSGAKVYCLLHPVSCINWIEDKRLKRRLVSSKAFL